MNQKEVNVPLIWLNVITAVGMSTCVFTGQLKIEMQIYGLTLIFPAANLFFALLTFPVTDIIADIWGKKEANRTVWVGFAAQYLTVLIVELCLLFPGDTDRLAPFHAGSWRVILGSSIAYLTAQFWDVFIFHWIKEKVTGDAHLWLRNNVSTCSSQLINSTIFIYFVFGPSALWVMLPSSIFVKWILAFIDTPLVYLGRNYLLYGKCFAERKKDLLAS